MSEEKALPRLAIRKAVEAFNSTLDSIACIDKVLHAEEGINVNQIAVHRESRADLIAQADKLLTIIDRAGQLDYAIAKANDSANPKDAAASRDRYIIRGREIYGRRIMEEDPT